MPSRSQSRPEQSPPAPQPPRESQSPPAPPPREAIAAATDPILCPHCRRTASNGIKCQGICVADSDY